MTDAPTARTWRLVEHVQRVHGIEVVNWLDAVERHRGDHATGLWRHESGDHSRTLDAGRAKP